jgi:hypothetical protein
MKPILGAGGSTGFFRNADLVALEEVPVDRSERRISQGNQFNNWTLVPKIRFAFDTIIWFFSSAIGSLCE